MTRLCFLIRQLNLGGAQRQLLALAAALARERYDVTLLTFYDGGLLQAQLDAMPQVKHISLHKSGRWDVLSFVLRLARELRRLRPQVLHSYLGVSNLLAVLLKPVLPRTRVVWGVRASDMDWSRYAWHERAVFVAQRVLARWADLIIVNSQAGFAFLRSQGFAARNLCVIQNGIDPQRFAPDAAARQRARAQWQLHEEHRLIGLIARFDPMKDHRTFLQAAAVLTRTHAHARFLCLGEGPQAYRQELEALTHALGLDSRVRWSASREDMREVYNALDILTSSSAYGEGFSNVIGEAMACGVPCVVTNVGDSADIVAASGIVVPPRDPHTLAAAWRQLLAEDAEQQRMRGEQARQRIVENFSTAVLAKKTSIALKNLFASVRTSYSPLEGGQGSVIAS